MMVILIAAIGIVNYILWKIYGPRGIDAQLSRCPDCGARLPAAAGTSRPRAGVESLPSFSSCGIDLTVPLEQKAAAQYRLKLKHRPEAGR
jgi:hypothetical protein